MKPKLRQAMEEFERESLSAVPTLFGRIVYLSWRRDGRRYHNPSLEARLGLGDTQIVLSKLHGDLVVTWSQLPMQERHSDILLFLASQKDSAVARKWLQTVIVDKLLPDDLGQTDRDLFLSGFGILLAII